MLYTIELYAINYITFFTEKKTYQMSYTQGESESEVAQSCPTLCDPMDSSLPGSAVHGIFQARILEWAAISFSNILKVCHIYSTDKTTVLVKVDIYLAHFSPCCVCAFSQIIHILHQECLSVSTLKTSSTLSVKSDLIPLVHSMISEDLKQTSHFHNQHPTICPSLFVCVWFAVHTSQETESSYTNILA